MQSLKYFPRLNVYKAANVSFNPSTVTATSYDWWTFVMVIDGLVVFNTAPYSVTTKRHQARVKQTMQELGITVNLEVSTRLSLTNRNALVDALDGAQKDCAFFLDKATKAKSLKSSYLSIAAKCAAQAEGITLLMRRMEKAGAA